MGTMQQMMLGSNSITPTVPSAPGTPSGSGATNGYITLGFSAASPNGSTITNYTVTSSPGGFTGSGSSSPISVSGLTNGTGYTFTVTATNGIGTGPASAASGTLTPSTIPDAPTIGSATAGNANASVSFSAPGYDGGAAISNYVVTSNPGSLTGSGSTSPITVSGLTNGTSYTFSVYAQNASGNGYASGSSNAVTPTAATVPSAPTVTNVYKGNGSASVVFTGSSSDGGSSITGYTATSSPGGLTGVSIGGFPILVSGLTNGTSYTFTVHATNGIGNSAESTPSSSVTLNNAQISNSAYVAAVRSGPGSATATYFVNSAGTITKALTPGGSSTIETWLLTGPASEFEVRFTYTGGDSPSSSSGMDTWLNLASIRSVQNTIASTGELNTYMDVEIRPAGGGTNYGVVSVTVSAIKDV